jgi:hypothetical protein
MSTPKTRAACSVSLQASALPVLALSLPICFAVVSLNREFYCVDETTAKVITILAAECEFPTWRRDTHLWSNGPGDPCCLAAALAASRLTADTSPSAIRRVRLCSSLYWKIQDRRPELNARIPKPRQLASQKNSSFSPDAHRILATLVFVKPTVRVAARFRLPVGNRITSADESSVDTLADGSTVEAEDIVDSDC